MTAVFDSIMQGEGTDSKIKALLVALHQKGETVDELAGAAAALRKHMTPIRTRRENCVDTCGTGGGNSGTFNISTAAAIVAASAGASVAKHGNRRSTSSSGSADVLAELGVKVDCTVEVTQKCLDQLGLCFCFAPLFHPSVKNVMKVRKSLDHPTIFNLIGPLCNPANAPYQILGAGRPETRETIARGTRQTWHRASVSRSLARRVGRDIDCRNNRRIRSPKNLCHRRHPDSQRLPVGAEHVNDGQSWRPQRERRDHSTGVRQARRRRSRHRRRQRSSWRYGYQGCATTWKSAPSDVPRRSIMAKPPRCSKISSR